ncbi:hypothetical protein [Kordia jejudonensis]|uniref:hypothetical protein n=1 Tax=Kordia jejudonensis TaxID=1348245 RepID=UPI00062975B9|nr:hypothetical protein [Kordia jejudonensis]
MKKMKKLNLNKVRIVSLKNLQSIHGGSTVCNPTGPTDPTGSLLCTAEPTIGPGTCPSTGLTYGGNDGGTLDAWSTQQTQTTQDVSKVLTECELAPI